MGTAFLWRLSLIGFAPRLLKGLMMQLTRNALNLMCQTHPSAQNAADIFKDSWYSRLPDMDGDVIATGATPLFDDARIRWAAEQAGGFEGKTILELGPLEGGH